jgi:hypothetical protein
MSEPYITLQRKDLGYPYESAIQKQNEYYKSIKSYKETSWFNLPAKLREKKGVRRAKRLTQQANHSLRSLNWVSYFTPDFIMSKYETQSMLSGSDTSSIAVSAGSPPGSNMAVDDLREWTYNVDDNSSGSGYEPEPGHETQRSSNLNGLQAYSLSQTCTVADERSLGC